MDGSSAEIHLFAAARAAVGRPSVSVEPGSLTQILDGLEHDFPAFAAVRPRCSYLLDGMSVHDADAAVAAGSRLDVLPPFSGG